jgi:hypothetical protein
MMADATRDLRTHLATLKALRGHAEQAPPRLVELKDWQSRRLAASYTDISSIPRYRAATAFFLEDLYGPKDFSGRDQAMIRIVPTMSKLLPASAVETAALAIELEALSESLDHRVAQALAPGPIDDATYAEAYRMAGTRAERVRQVALIGQVGRRLDALVKKPLVLRTLRLMRRPAKLAGLEDLQDFLERGFESFRLMAGADEFLALICERETAILNRLFSGAREPFSI